MLVIGHRGAAGLPENTVPSFERALELGAGGLELDVRITGDEKLVVVHASVVGSHAVQSSSYEEIRQLPDGGEVPLLEDVLKQFAKRTFLDIEFKTPGFEEEAVKLIKRYGKVAKTMVSGFHPDTLTKVHELLPDLQLGFIYNRTQDEESRHNCPIDVVIPQFRLASRELIAEVHSEGLQVFAWTVNEESEIRRLKALGVDGIITDYPEVAVAVANG